MYLHQSTHSSSMHTKMALKTRHFLISVQFPVSWLEWFCDGDWRIHKCLNKQVSEYKSCRQAEWCFHRNICLCLHPQVMEAF